ncbi:MAG: YibE/F family protein, partial [Clostridiales bacterium]
LLILLAYDTPFASLTNMDIVATEIVRSLAGSIGLIMTIPITAFTATLLLKGKKKTNNRTRNAS